MAVAERRTARVEVFAAQRLGLIKLALIHQQHGHVADGDEGGGVAVAKRRTSCVEVFAAQQLGLIKLALILQQRRRVADGGEGVGVAVAERRTARVEGLAAQRLGLIELALIVQLARQRGHGDKRDPTGSALCLKPRPQQGEAQCIAVVVVALATAVGSVFACAPPALKAGRMDPPGGAAARARLHEQTISLVPKAQPTRPLLLT